MKNGAFSRVVIVCGSRDWTDVETVRRRLAQLPPRCIILHGDCSGADKIAATEAKKMGHAVTGTPFIEKMGRGGGPVRNRIQLDLALGLESMGYRFWGTIAFHENLNRSKGTRDMLDETDRHHRHFEIITGPLDVKDVDEE